MALYYRAQGTQLRTVNLPPIRTPMARSGGMPGWLKPFGFLFASPQAAAQRLLDTILLAPDANAAALSDKETQPTAALMDVIRQCGAEVV